ncbi:phytanoyl-CoA dioxygenase family protein [Nannocystis punicea]|uniref:Phytanoyl-CoA dioxygenase family protein n=1 Tax=Nannocystis punicea TaxID=2995304 RepID=A0ABY7GWZ9_9BACT|nr:phytanoyl-CoA dioxygenase family protein [Nannocystis poenicansa]WAS91511.1 phytanoyl-CoA dioxygenase family protein [Nannocystis poenicansa]
MLDHDTLQSEKLQFWRDGFVVVRNMFTRDEMAVVKRKVAEIEAMNARVDHLRTQQALGEHPSFETIFVWNDVVGDDLFAKIGRSYKILDRLSHYYEDDVYDYHNKIVLKYPGIVGFRPHQDYAYWQGYGCRFPEAHAVFVAVDAATRENGCLKLVPRSHLLGTLPHGGWSARGSDDGVLPEELEALFARGYAFEPIEAEPGDAILFHGNTIHGSDDNGSDQPRIAMVATMNTRRNSPDPRHNRPGHPYWSRQARVTAPITDADLALPLPRFDLRCEPDAAPTPT